MASHVYTILFTDIEGSTRLWEQQGETMAAALAVHDARTHGAVERHRGTIVKTTGDGLYAVFPDPVDAVAATVEMQRSLVDPAETHGIPIRVRCGLHLGTVEHRNNDYFGSPVNRTARLMSVAHGGQIIVSQAVCDQVESRLPEPVTLRDLGSVRLKDLAQPEHVWQVLHPDLRQDFPALRSLEATPNNLPQHLTTFIGREREVAEAEALLKTTRLLTLVGMGGLGKTRLSQQIAADVLDAHPDGVWFVDLAPITDASLVPATAAQVLNVREEPGKPVTQTLCAHLKPLKSLLILDNCEHVVAACAELANALLRGTPDVRILATTREALRVPGEQTYPVLPLPLPDRAADLEALSRSDAVQLFVDRAQLSKPGFALTEKEAPAVAELCARLEGIPLALELAAARMRAMSLADINKRLNDRFKLLTGGGRVLLERQQTLRALVAWSYDLLNESEQRLLERLGVFVGGFDLEAAEAVCGAEPLAPEDVLDLLTSLVEKSLVMIDEGEAGTRYRQLETIRDFERECLARREDAPAIAKWHCEHFFVVAKAIRDGLKGSEHAESVRRGEADLDNLRSAIGVALARKADPVLAAKLVVAMQGFWILRGYATEGRRYVRAALDLPEVKEMDVAHAHALYVGAALANIQGDNAIAAQMLDDCLALRRAIGNPVDVAATLSTFAHVRLQQDQADQARECEEEALAIFREIGDRIGEAIGLSHLGDIEMHVSNDGASWRYFEECWVIATEIDHAELVAECELALGMLALERNDLTAARERLGRSLAISRNSENRRGEAMALWWSGKADLIEGKTSEANVKLSAALTAFQSYEMNIEALGCLEDHARMCQSAGDPDDAALLLGAAEALRERLRLPIPPRWNPARQRAIEAARAALAGDAFGAVWSEGRGLELENAVRRALAAAKAHAAAS